MNKKKEEDKKEHLSIQINEKLNEYLDEFIENNGLKKSQLIESLLKKYIDTKSIKFPTKEEINNESLKGYEKQSFFSGALWTIEFIKNNN
jgi:metal-responsive CopG/Arc/MetJ family transcriptional regulator